MAYAEKSILLLRNQITKTKGKESFFLFCVTWLHSRRAETTISKSLSSHFIGNARFGAQAEGAAPFLEEKGIGGCGWAVCGGAGKQWR